MRQPRIWLLAVVGALLMFSTVSSVLGVTVVKPSNMNGWVAAVHQGTDVNATEPTFAFSNNVAPPFLDAFYASVGASIQPPDGTREEATNEVWLGTDEFVGVKLVDITRLEYSSFTCWSGNLGDDWDSTVSQPIKLTMSIKIDGLPDNLPPEERTDLAPKNWRNIMLFPWGQNDAGLRTWDRTPYGCWQTWDATSPDLEWFVQYDADGEVWQNWDRIVEKYPNATIEHAFSYADNLAANNAYGGAATGISDPWGAPYPAESRYQASTLTGKGLNFQVGARRTFQTTFGTYWWKGGYNFRGYVDQFVVGVNGVDTVFDFQADVPPAAFYAMSNQSAVSPVMENGEQNFHVVLWGRVVEDPEGIYSPEFLIDDGSGVNIKVKAIGNTVYNGCYIRAAGVLLHDFVEDDGPPPVIQPTLLSDAANVTILVPGIL